MLNSNDFLLPLDSKPGLMLSGGADSSLLLWLLVKNNFNLTTFTIERKHGELENSKKIVDWVNNYFKSSIPYPVMMQPESNDHSMHIRFALRKIFQKKLASHLYFGITQNPPVKLSGNVPIRHSTDNEKLITPFWHLNKQHIIHLYKNFDIMELFDITNSCQIYVDKHCGECFHCQERSWGLNNGI